ncbi:hypothetical protein [Sessilibacter sp. MAH4]
MSCLVDTINFDRFFTGECFGIDDRNSTTAIFRVDNPPANFYIDWHDPSCSPTSLSCSTTIFAYVDYVGSATVIDLSTGATQTISATARLENFF